MAFPECERARKAERAFQKMIIFERHKVALRALVLVDIAVVNACFRCKVLMRHVSGERLFLMCELEMHGLINNNAKRTCSPLVVPVSRTIRFRSINLLTLVARLFICMFCLYEQHQLQFFRHPIVVEVLSPHNRPHNKNTLKIMI